MPQDVRKPLKDRLTDSDLVRSLYRRADEQLSTVVDAYKKWQAGERQLPLELHHAEVNEPYKLLESSGLIQIRGSMGSVQYVSIVPTEDGLRLARNGRQ